MKAGFPCMTCERVYRSLEAAERCEAKHDAAKAAAEAAKPLVCVTTQVVAQAEDSRAQDSLRLVLDCIRKGAKPEEVPFLLAQERGAALAVVRERDALLERVKLLEAERVA